MEYKTYVLARTSNPAANHMLGKLVFVQRHIEAKVARIVDAKTGNPIWITSPVCYVDKKEGISLKLITNHSTYFFVEISK